MAVGPSCLGVMMMVMFCPVVERGVHQILKGVVPASRYPGPSAKGRDGEAISLLSLDWGRSPSHFPPSPCLSTP